MGWLDANPDGDEQTVSEGDVSFDIDNLFPFPSYRPYQKEAIVEAAHALYEDDYDTVVLNLPTGIGKSPANLTLSRMADSAYITTPSKKLRRQLETDDVLNDYYSVLGGRADYFCSVGSTTCDQCPVRFDGDESCRQNTPGCSYWLSKQQAMDDDISVLTFAYLILDGKIPTETEGGEPLSFEDRELLVVDEAQSLIGQTTSMFAAFTASPDTLPPEVYEGTTHYLTENEWLMEEATDALDFVESNAKSFVKENEDVDDSETQFAVQQCEEFVDKYRWAKQQLEVGRDWVVEVEEWQPNSSMVSTLQITFSPVDADSFLKRSVWSRSDKRVLSTATMPYFNRPDVWLERLGLDPDNAKVIQRPMPFPTENRRVNTQYEIAKMSNGGDFDNWDEIVGTLRTLSDKHDGEKGLVHTASYKRAHMLNESLPDRTMVHDKTIKSDDMIEKWQGSDKQMLLSPSMMEGVDLKGDMCRWQALVKVPYPSPNDPRTKLLLEERNAWGSYYEGIGTAVVQSVGRGVRSMDDYCTFYCIDKSFDDVFRRASMPDWFAEAVDGYNV